MRDTETALEAAKRAAREAANKVAILEARLALEKSFSRGKDAIAVVRRSIDTGSFQKIEGVFTDDTEAQRFAASIAGYGVGKDVFIENVPFYS